MKDCFLVAVIAYFMGEMGYLNLALSKNNWLSACGTEVTFVLLGVRR